MNSVSRRRFLKHAAGAGLGFALSSCGPSWYCPPSVRQPVLDGHQDFTQGTDGAPVDLRVFYPSFGSGGAYEFPILSECASYPLVVFCHGNCTEPDHYKKWFLLPAGLARSGYVVVVPRLQSTADGSPPYLDPHPDFDLLKQVVNWMHQGWKSSKLITSVFTGVVGHSYGSELGGRLALELKASAYASLSGGWEDWPDSIPTPINSLKIPKLFMWGTGSDLSSELKGGRWDAVPPFKHAVQFQGANHWDYLASTKTACASVVGGYGPCNLVESVAADFVATFMSKYMPPPEAAFVKQYIPDNLVPQDLQSFVIGNFKKGHLNGLLSLFSQKSCKVTETWVGSSGPGGPVTLPTP